MRPAPKLNILPWRGAWKLRTGKEKETMLTKEIA
jgi:hypothetical protein